MSSTLQAVIVTLCIMALAGLFALLEALSDRRAWRRREEAERARTTGTLVGFAEKRYRRGKIRNRNRRFVSVYHPIVRFHADGCEYKLESTDIISRDQYQVGQPVDLLYDPYNPAHFHLDRGGMQARSTRDAVIFALAWLACSLAAIALLICTNV